MRLRAAGCIAANMHDNRGAAPKDASQLWCFTGGVHDTGSASRERCNHQHLHTFPHTHHTLQGFEKTGLGERIANLFVRAMGKSTLGLALGLVVAETALAPAMPSTSARAGGIFMPIIKSLSEASGSYASEWCERVWGDGCW